jgi:carboxymethylenebutenolidase
MRDRLTIEGRHGAFSAYIARPMALPAPAVVVLHEIFGVNADIRTTCDELAEQGFIAAAPDLFWRQEPGVDLRVNSEPDWQHGLSLYQAYDRDAGVGDINDTLDAMPKQPDCTGKMAVQGYCFGALMTFLTAVRCHVDAAVAYHGADTEKYLGEVDNLRAPQIMHLGEEDELIPRRRKPRSRRHLPADQTRQSTTIRANITPSPGIRERTTTPPRQHSPTGGQANFYINNCGDLRSLQPSRAMPEENEHANSPSQHATVEHHLAEAL